MKGNQNDKMLIVINQHGKHLADIIDLHIIELGESSDTSKVNKTYTARPKETNVLLVVNDVTIQCVNTLICISSCVNIPAIENQS